MSIRIFRTLAPTLLAVLTLSTTAKANWRDIPLGGRTATMGGAATASGTDSAMPYLNPAGLAGVPSSVFALSANIYQYSRLTIDKVFAPEGVANSMGRLEDQELRLNTTRIGSLPSSVMYFDHLSDPKSPVQHHLGFAMVVPAVYGMNVSGGYVGGLPDVRGAYRDTLALNVLSTDYFFGPSYAVAIGKNIRLGLSAFCLYHKGHISLIQSTTVTEWSGAFQVGQRSNGDVSEDAVGGTIIAGSQLRLVGDLWLGAGVALPTFGVWGRRTESSNTAVTSTTSSGADRTWGGTFELTYDWPLRLNGGLAYDKPGKFAIAADVSYFAARKNVYSFKGSGSSVESRSGELTRTVSTPVETVTSADATVHVSIGGEVFLSPTVAVRAGFFTNPDHQPKLTADHVWEYRVNRMGGSLGLGVLLGPIDTSFGVVYSHGSGQFVAQDLISQAVMDAQRTLGSVRDLSEDTLFLVLAGAVTTSQAKETIQRTLPVKFDALPDLPGGKRETSPAQAPNITPKVDAPKPEVPKPEPPKPEEPKPDAPKPDVPSGKEEPSNSP